MKLPIVHPSTESKARQEYENFRNLCMTSNGLDRLLIKSDDPKTVAIIERTRKLDDQLKEYDEDVKNGSMTVILRRLLGRSGDVNRIRRISEDIQEANQLLFKTTKLRGDYKLLSSVALLPSLDSIAELTTAYNFTGTWILDLEHTDGWPSGLNIGPPSRETANTIASVIEMLMRELDLTHRSLHEWWRASHLDNKKQETLIWNDLRVMARRVVFLLDDLEDDTLKTIGQFCECVVMADRIARSIILFVDAHPDRVEVMHPCLELLAPVLYVLSLSKNGLLAQSSSELLQVLLALFHQLLTLVEACSNSQPVTSADSNQTEEQHGEIHSGLGRDLGAAGPVEQGARRESSSNRTLYSADQLKRFRLDKIELEEMPCAGLGSGSYSVVNLYKARGRDAEYAVKTFSRIDGDFDDKRIWNHIFREARIWSDIDCENINKLLGYCTLPNDPYPGLVMEVCNWNLQNYCTTHKVETDSRLNFMLDVANGLNYLHTHEARYAHGDLRTENILIRVTNTKPRPFAVLTDFGVADMAQIDFNNVAYNTAGQVAPKQYLAPEFWKDLPKGTVKVSEKADMYAFGCVFAIVVCKVTELYKNAGEKLRKMKERGEPPVAKEQLPDTYRQFVYKLWNKAPERRPSASEAISVINKFIVYVRSKGNHM